MEVNLTRLLVRFRYAARYSDEVDLYAGDAVEGLALKGPPGRQWWYGLSRGHYGIFPANFVVPLDNAGVLTYPERSRNVPPPPPTGPTPSYAYVSSGAARQALLPSHRVVGGASDDGKRAGRMLRARQQDPVEQSRAQRSVFQTPANARRRLEERMLPPPPPPGGRAPGCARLAVTPRGSGWTPTQPAPQPPPPPPGPVPYSAVLWSTRAEDERAEAERSRALAAARAALQLGVQPAAAKARSPSAPRASRPVPALSVETHATRTATPRADATAAAAAADPVATSSAAAAAPPPAQASAASKEARAEEAAPSGWTPSAGLASMFSKKKGGGVPLMMMMKAKSKLMKTVRNKRKALRNKRKDFIVEHRGADLARDEDHAAEMEQLAKIPKSAVEQELIKKALRSHFLFASISGDMMRSVIAVAEKLTHDASGVDVVTQGDRGDRFYIVNSGAFVSWAAHIFVRIILLTMELAPPYHLGPTFLQRDNRRAQRRNRRQDHRNDRRWRVLW